MTVALARRTWVIAGLLVTTSPAAGDPAHDPIESRGITASASAGSHDTKRAELRASEQRGANGFELTGSYRDARTQHGDTASVSAFGARWRLHRLEFATGPLEHELSAGVGLVRTAGSTHEVAPPEMDTHMTMLGRTRQGKHRFLDAYIEDTLRVIHSLDVTSGLVIENWSHLGGNDTLHYGGGAEMEETISSTSEVSVSPSFGVRGRVDHTLAVRARASHHVTPPTFSELYRPLHLDDIVIAAAPDLRPESAWRADVGPELAAGPLTARVALAYTRIDAPVSTVELGDGLQQRANLDAARSLGVETEASLRPSKAWHATVAYSFTSSTVTRAADADLVGRRLALAPRQRATARLTYDAPRFASISGSLRYIDRQFADARNTFVLPAYTLVDVMAARRVAGGVAGFVAIENLLDRRHTPDRSVRDELQVQGAPRTLHVGLRIDTRRF